jgi:hypothetical protein
VWRFQEILLIIKLEFIWTDSSGGSGELAINGIYDADLTTITIEILSDTNLSASTSGDFG